MAFEIITLTYLLTYPLSTPLLSVTLNRRVWCIFVQAGVSPENNDFVDFRIGAIELVRDFVPCIRASDIMKQVV